MRFAPSPITILPTPYAVDTLPAPSAAMVGIYARVTDLFGEKTDLVLCSAFGGSYFWQPVRPLWARSTPAVSMTLRPLKNPSLLRLTGTLSANTVIAIDPALAWPGCQFEIAMDGTLGIYSLTIAGLALGATVALLLGGRKRLVFDGADYQVF